MSQDGNAIQYRQTKMGDSMDKGRSGIMMEVYSSGDTSITGGLKGRSMSCSQIALTHSSILSICEDKR
jgi:hypothetical protein